MVAVRHSKLILWVDLTKVVNAVSLMAEEHNAKVADYLQMNRKADAN